MVLTDDNFATIVSAIHRGRVLYDNIVKFVRFQLSTTIGAILTVFFAPLVGLPEPFTPLQILWIAVIMDGPPADFACVRRRPPGPDGASRRDRETQPLLSLSAPRKDPRLWRHDDGRDTVGPALRAADRHRRRRRSRSPSRRSCSSSSSTCSTRASSPDRHSTRDSSATGCCGLPSAACSHCRSWRSTGPGAAPVRHRRPSRSVNGRSPQASLP